MGEEWIWPFDVGDKVVLLNADEVETNAGRNIMSDCTHMHSRVTELAGCEATLIKRDGGEFIGRIPRKIVTIRTDRGEVINCHPEWLCLVNKSFDTDDIGFKVGDRVMLLNADEIEIAAGHTVSSSCTGHHTNVTERAGELAYVNEILEDTYYGGIGARRHCIQVVTDDGSELCCHPEWLQLLKGYDEQDTTDLDALFEEFSV